MRCGYGSVAAALAAALIAILVGATGAGAITNGQPDGNNHPYVGVMVGVNFTDELAWLCTGSLLDGDSFLTAGHCTDGADAIFVWFDQTYAAADRALQPPTRSASA